MEIKIGPCVLSRRTEYSKYKLFNAETGEDITDQADNILDKLILDYNNQRREPEKYFKISSNSLYDFFIKNARDTRYIFIPDSVEKIEEDVFISGAFSYIHLSETLKTIENFAFSECSSLKFIEIPNTVSRMGVGVFSKCKNLSHIFLPNMLDNIPPQTFMDCYNLSEITIPNLVSEIGDNAFKNCNGLKKVNFGSSLKLLGSNAFFCCKSLNEIELPHGLCEIRDGCFSLCKSLKKIYIPDSVYKLCDGIFSKTEELENVNIPLKLYSVAGSPFAESSIASLTFNFDLEDMYTTEGLITKSNINKLIIDKNCHYITPAAFKVGGHRIKTIDYLGTEEEFLEFKNRNSGLFKCFRNLEKINFLEKTIKDPGIVQER